MKKSIVIIFLFLGCFKVFSQTLKIELDSIPATISGQCTGKIWSNVSGGTAPYKFIWNTGDTTAFIENVCLGKYKVTITDALDSIAQDSVQFVASSQLIVPLNVASSVFNPYYGQCKGNISLSPFGTKPYRFKLYNALSGVLILDSTMNMLNQYLNIGNLCIGRYYAVTTDSNNSIDFRYIPISPKYLSLGNTGWNNNYKIGNPITITGYGNAPINISVYHRVNDVNIDTVIYSLTNSGDSINFTPTKYGNYLVDLYDNINNREAYSICIHEELSDSLSTLDAINGCDGQVLISDTVLYDLVYLTFPRHDFDRSFKVENNNLCPGNYYALIYSKYCSQVFVNTPVFTIGGPQPDYPVLTTSSVNANYMSCNGEIMVDATGGTPPYKYKWSNDWFYSNFANDTLNFIDSLCANDYYLKVTDNKGVWTLALVSILSDSVATLPGDTLRATVDTCILAITDYYISQYTIHSNTIDVKWAIVQNGVTSYLDVTYNYTIAISGDYIVELVLNCRGVIKLYASLQLLTSSFDNNYNEKILIYPNPTSDILNVIIKNKASLIELYTISGQKISSYEVRGTQMAINVSDLASGVYLIRLYNEDGTSVVKKFVK